MVGVFWDFIFIFYFFRLGEEEIDINYGGYEIVVGYVVKKKLEEFFMVEGNCECFLCLIF